MGYEASRRPTAPMAARMEDYVKGERLSGVEQWFERGAERGGDDVSGMEIHLRPRCCSPLSCSHPVAHSLELTSQLYAGQNGVSERVANLQISFDRRSVRVRNIRGFGGSFLKA